MEKETNKKRPQDIWNEKAGYISKSYKLKKELVEQFASSCKDAGVSQAGQLSKMMLDFINSTKKEESDEWLFLFYIKRSLLLTDFFGEVLHFLWVITKNYTFRGLPN